jgi:cell division septation protein DedD
MTALALAGTAILVALVVVLVHTLKRLRAQEARRAETADALAAHNQREHDERLKSLEMIALACLSGDCELSEGCLRIRHLIGHYPGLRDDPAFAPIEALYQEIRGFDVGDDRRALTRRELEAQDAARFEIEGRHRATVLESFGRLRERAVALQGSAYDIELATGAPVTDRAA